MSLREEIRAQFINTSAASPLIYGPITYLLQWKTLTPLALGVFRVIFSFPIKIAVYFQNQLPFTVIRVMKVFQSIPKSSRWWKKLFLLRQTLEGCRAYWS